MMKYFLPTVLGAATIALIQPQATLAQTAIQTDARAIAEHFTVKVNPDGAWGSGAIVGKKNNVYYVLTARHVVDDIRAGEELWLITHDNQDYQVDVDAIELLPNNIDLALIQFTSDRDYPVATISQYNYRLYEPRDYDNNSNSNALENKQYVYVSGWPLREEKRVFNPGFLFDNSASAVSAPDVANPDDNFGGYELIYTNLTHPGMSGGAVVDTAGRLIGIHGRGDGRVIGEEDEIIRQYLDEVGGNSVKIKIGLSLGIPIQSFLSWAADRPINDYLSVENTAPPNLNSNNLKSWQPPLSVTDKSNPYHWIEKGNQLWRIGRVAEARGSFERAIELEEDLYLAWFAKGFTLGFDRQFDRALTACDRAIKLNVLPTKIKYESFRCKAGALQQLQRPAEALTALNKALEINSNNSADWMLQGELYFALKEYEAALKSLDRAVELRENQNITPSSLLHNNRALIALELSQYELALEEVDKAIAIDSSFAPAWRNKGLILETIDRNQESLTAYHKALELDPKDYNTWTNIGFTLYKLQRYQDAKQSFEKALEINPNYQPAIDNLNAIN
ncbi:serine protease [Waterburya agarophytonicola K14]|uniref:Serine protease n=1 Tax=Waterburya agarophytonicola KI4 TaxID=2874699 RepID=A0A964FFR1_9CYAN|nr:tetratricopeptide repeat-containing serine protease family protein [Waterburya agarophytonicola]MCC0177282.1 serine protease [Waterburya agarophytonicola KI4]